METKGGEEEEKEVEVPSRKLGYSRRSARSVFMASWRSAKVGQARLVKQYYWDTAAKSERPIGSGNIIGTPQLSREAPSVQVIYDGLGEREKKRERERGEKENRIESFELKLSNWKFRIETFKSKVSKGNFQIENQNKRKISRATCWFEAGPSKEPLPHVCSWSTLRVERVCLMKCMRTQIRKTQDEPQWIVAQRLLSALTIPGFS